MRVGGVAVLVVVVFPVAFEQKFTTIFVFCLLLMLLLFWLLIGKSLMLRGSNFFGKENEYHYISWFVTLVRRRNH